MRLQEYSMLQQSLIDGGVLCFQALQSTDCTVRRQLVGDAQRRIYGGYSIGSDRVFEYVSLVLGREPGRR